MEWEKLADQADGWVGSHVNVSRWPGTSYGQVIGLKFGRDHFVLTYRLNSRYPSGSLASSLSTAQVTVSRSSATLVEMPDLIEIRQWDVSVILYRDSGRG